MLEQDSSRGTLDLVRRNRPENHARDFEPEGTPAHRSGGTHLLFKTIDVQQVESHLDFHRVPDDLTLAQAADILDKQIVMASNR